MANNFMDVFVLLLVGGILLPIGLNQWFTANTTEWDATTALIWPLVATLGVVALAIGSIRAIQAVGGKR